MRSQQSYFGALTPSVSDSGAAMVGPDRKPVPQRDSFGQSPHGGNEVSPINSHPKYG